MSAANSNRGASTPAFPRDPALDSTLALLSEGYQFIPNRCERLRSDVFQTRLMLRTATCVSGEDAARMFYHPDRFTRKGAIPPTTLMLLQDFGSVQRQNGASHRHRKQLFTAIAMGTTLDSLVELARSEWRDAVARWMQLPEIVLHREVESILTRAVCRWAGIPLSDDDAERRAREFGGMVDGAGSVGLRSVRGMLLRSRTEHWAREIIGAVRSGVMDVTYGSAVQAVALHRDENGDLLEQRHAAVELLNLLRPTVAVARYITFSALALHEYPSAREALLSGHDDELERFVQEVRRYYPFFPLVGGRVREPFEWRGHAFEDRDWVLLDLYGTNRDPRIWDDPESFRPDRFRDWNGNAFNFIPQGGGDVHRTHRCPGEQATIALTKDAVRALLFDMRYEVPEQDLSMDLSRMPAIPESRFVLRRVVQRVAGSRG